MQAIATLGAVPHLLRLLESTNEVIAEGASETMLHIVTPSEGNAASHPGQSAARAAGVIPSLLGVVRAPCLDLPCTRHGAWQTLCHSYLAADFGQPMPSCSGRHFHALEAGLLKPYLLWRDEQ